VFQSEAWRSKDEIYIDDELEGSGGGPGGRHPGFPTDLEASGSGDGGGVDDEDTPEPEGDGASGDGREFCPASFYFILFCLLFPISALLDFFCL